jgi:hypothetical protein
MNPWFLNEHEKVSAADFFIPCHETSILSLIIMATLAVFFESHSYDLKQ